MEKRYNVQAFSLVGEAPEITYHDTYSEKTQYFSSAGVFLYTLDDRASLSNFHAT